MPIREYWCVQCNQGRERIELGPNDGSAQPECQVCKMPMVRIFPTRTSFRLKGDGWPGKSISSEKGSG